jgi:hypothetical protein
LPVAYGGLCNGFPPSRLHRILRFLQLVAHGRFRDIMIMIGQSGGVGTRSGRPLPAGVLRFRSASRP